LIQSIFFHEKGATMQIKKIVIILLVCSAATVLFIACGGTGTTVGTTPTPTIESTTGNTGISGSSTEVHMSYQSFAQSSVAIRKGSRITLVDDVAVPHTIANGAWDNNSGKPLQETNAPVVRVQLKGNDQQVIGPFTTAGTYHLYCTIHPGMNLTVIVQ
jgi:plastocyanin